MPTTLELPSERQKLNIFCVKLLFLICLQLVTLGTVGDKMIWLFAFLKSEGIQNLGLQFNIYPQHLDRVCAIPCSKLKNETAKLDGKLFTALEIEFRKNKMYLCARSITAFSIFSSLPPLSHKKHHCESL